MSGVSLRSENDLRLSIVGNPENRRVRDFQSTAVRLGCERPECVRWRDLLDNRQAALARLQTAGFVRLESPGENDEVLHRLIRLGGGQGRLAFGEIGFLREQFRGFCRILEELSPLGPVYQNPPADIEVMFDKWASHGRFVEAGLPRPLARLAPGNAARFRSFRSAFGTTDSGRVFLKPRYASSASRGGVCAYRWSHGREQLIGPIEIQDDGRSVRLYNSLRVRRYTSLPAITAILDSLLPQDMICERWVPKARLPDGQFDLRILVIAGRARHTVVRQSHFPMTNLHLGNRRGKMDEVSEAFGADAVDECFRLAEKAADCFPNSLYAGVDVILPSKGAPMICEINAFGDLLPGVTDRGDTAYEAILRAWRQSRSTLPAHTLADWGS